MKRVDQSENTIIVIITFNALQWLKRCLESTNGYQVVIVDNASTDGTVAYIKNNFPEVHLLEQTQNLGFGQANNLGMRYALDQGAEFVFLLNQDAYLQSGCLETLIKVHTENSDYGILSPIHLNGSGNRLDRNFSNYVNYTANPDFYSDFVLKKPLQEIYEVPFVNAAGWLLSRDILEKVGGFDPIFFHYGEDDNYCQRARFHGFKIGVVPTAFLYHDRAERPKKEIKHASSAYFELKEKNFKVKYANINEENLDQLYKLLKRRQKYRQRALVKLNFSNANYLKKEIDLLKQIIPQIEKSRKLTLKNEGSLYLNDNGGNVNF